MKTKIINFVTLLAVMVLVGCSNDNPYTGPTQILHYSFFQNMEYDNNHPLVPDTLVNAGSHQFNMHIFCLNEDQTAVDPAGIADDWDKIEIDYGASNDFWVRCKDKIDEEERVVSFWIDENLDENPREAYVRVQKTLNRKGGLTLYYGIIKIEQKGRPDSTPFEVKLNYNDRQYNNKDE